MIVADLLEAVIRLNLAAAAAVLAVLVLRRFARPLVGPGVAYGLWLLVPAAAAASLLPAKKQVLHYVLPLQAQLDPTALAAAPAMAPEGPPPIDYGPLVLALWAAGVLLTGAVLVWRQRRFLKSAGALARTAEPDLSRSDAPGVGPAVIGAVVPRIVVPADFDARFDADERTLVLAHERAHLARQDARINALVAAIQCVFWFNPLIHLAARALRMDQELACDALVIAKYPDARRRYAEAMLKTQLTATPLPFGCYWPPSSVEPLKERIAMLKLKSPSLARKLTGGAAIVALTAGAGFAAWAAKPAHVVLETEIAAAKPGTRIETVTTTTETTTTETRDQATPAPAPRFDAARPAVVAGQLAAMTLAVADPTPPAPPAPPAAPTPPPAPPAPPAPRAARPPAPPAPPAPPRVYAMRGDMKVRCKLGAAGKVESCSMPAMGAPKAGEIDVPFTAPDTSEVTARAMRESDRALRESDRARQLAAGVAGRPPLVIDTRAVGELGRKQGELERRVAELQSKNAAASEIAAAKAAADANRAQLDAEAKRLGDEAARYGAQFRIQHLAPPAPPAPPATPAPAPRP